MDEKIDDIDVGVIDAATRIADAIEMSLVAGDDQSTIVESVENLARQTRNIAHAITPLDAAAGPGVSGGTVGSLTEAVMDLNRVMSNIASAIQAVADAISEHNQR